MTVPSREPGNLLQTSAFSVEAAEKWALDRAGTLSEELFRLTALWSVSFVRQPAPEERKTHYTMRVAQAENYGLAATAGRPLPGPDTDMVGLDTRLILKKKLYRGHMDRTAFVDLVIGHVSRRADKNIQLGGTARDKYVARSEIFADEAERVLKRKGLKGRAGSRPRVLVIGATAGIISALAKRGFQVRATDLSPAVVRRELGGVTVSPGRDANALHIEQADLAIITGMTLPNRTLEGLMELAKEHNTATLIWAISGRNLGHYYTEHGVDCVISDPSPFLLFPGPATLAIWRRKTQK